MSLKQPAPKISLSRAAGTILFSTIGATVAYASWASQPLVKTMSVQWTKPASGNLSVDMSAKHSTRTSDGGIDLSGDVVFKVTADSLSIAARNLKSEDIGDTQKIEADGYVEIKFGAQTVTTEHAVIAERAGTGIITMDRGHLDNPGY